MEEQTDKTSSLYSPLDAGRKEIRILHLYPSGSLTGPVHCHLETVSLQDEAKPRYEAISYVWSEHVGTAPITINNTLVHDAPASSVNVLRQFRLESKKRRLWIDALCINQADLDERSSQVAIMGDIYRNTEITRIWVGDEDEDTGVAVQDFKALSEDIFPSVMDEDLLLREGIDIEKVVDQAGIHDLRAVAGFLGRVWFSRVWVLQECILPPRCTCKCGEWEINWENISRAASLLPYIPQYLISCDEMGIARNNVRIPFKCLTPDPSRTGSETFRVLYDLSEALQATDPRDKFFALHGLSNVSMMSLNEQRLLGIDVDYRRPLGEVLRNATRFALTDICGLGLLHEVGPKSTDCCSSGGLQSPSWILDWGTCGKSSRSIRAPLRRDEPDHGPNIALVRADVGTNRLMLEGFEFDRVAHVMTLLDVPGAKDCPSAAPERITLEFLREHIFEVVTFFKACRDFVNQLRPLHLAPELILTMLMEDGLDQVREQWSDRTWAIILGILGSAKFFEAAIMPTLSETRSCLAAHGVNTSEATMEAVTYARKICLRLILNCLERRIFATQQGRIGIGSKCIQNGDEIVAFLGSDMPFVVRQITGESSITPAQHRLRRLKATFKLLKGRHTQRYKAPSGFRLLGSCWMHSFIENREMQQLVESQDGLTTFTLW